MSQILPPFQIFLLSFRLKKESQSILPTHHLHIYISWVPQIQQQQTYLNLLYDSLFLSPFLYLWKPQSTTQCSPRGPQVRGGVDNYKALKKFNSRCNTAMALFLLHHWNRPWLVRPPFFDLPQGTFQALHMSFKPLSVARPVMLSSLWLAFKSSLFKSQLQSLTQYPYPPLLFTLYPLTNCPKMGPDPWPRNLQQRKETGIVSPFFILPLSSSVALGCTPFIWEKCL